MTEKALVKVRRSRNGVSGTLINFPYRVEVDDPTFPHFHADNPPYQWLIANGIRDFAWGSTIFRFKTEDDAVRFATKWAPVRYAIKR